MREPEAEWRDPKNVSRARYRLREFDPRTVPEISENAASSSSSVVEVPTY
jgi:hypothetical protein